MKQIIENIIPNRKAALIAVITVVLLLCVSAAIPFTAGAFGKGFLPEETHSTGVGAQEYAQVLADKEILKAEAEQKDESIRSLQEENQILRDALALSEEEANELARLLSQSEAEQERLQESLELLLSEHSKKYLVKVTVTGEYIGGIVKLSWPDYFYATEEEFAQYQRGDILAGHPEVGHPSTGTWTVIVEDKLSIELEGID